jgi:hypothetical protein
VEPQPVRERKRKRKRKKGKKKREIFLFSFGLSPCAKLSPPDAAIVAKTATSTGHSLGSADSRENSIQKLTVECFERETK